MAADKIYDLAFQYKKTKLWKKLADSDIFAVRLSDGEIGYCCIMGKAGQINALAVYVGDNGFQSYLNTAELSANPNISDDDYMSLMLEKEVLLIQDCLQCEFTNKEELLEEEIEEVRAYTKSHGLTLRGANAFPRFLKFQPYYYPWHLTREIDERRLCDALEACLELSELLRTKSKEDIGFPQYAFTAKTIPLLERKKGRYILTSTDLPSKKEIAYQTPVLTNDILIARIKKLKKSGILGCEAIRLPEPVQIEPDTAPYFPMLLLAVDKDRDMILPMEPVLDFESHPQIIPEMLAQTFIESKSCPKTILTNSERTFALLQDLCNKTGIRITLKEDELDWFEYAKDELLYHLYGNENMNIPIHEMMADIFDTIMSLDDNAIRQMPNELIQSLFDMDEAGALPPEIAARLHHIFQKQ